MSVEVDATRTVLPNGEDLGIAFSGLRGRRLLAPVAYDDGDHAAFAAKAVVRRPLSTEFTD